MSSINKFIYVSVLKVKLPGLLVFRGKKSKISRDFQGQIRGIFAGKKSKFAQNRLISRDFCRRKSKFAEKLDDFAGF